MFTVTPGTYNVFNKDGSFLLWGQEKIRVEITTDRKTIHIYTGDYEKPRVVCEVTSRIKNNSATLDQMLRMICKTAMIGDVLRITEVLAETVMVIEDLRLAKYSLNASYAAKQIDNAEWQEKLREINSAGDIAMEMVEMFKQEILRVSPDADIQIDL